MNRVGLCLLSIIALTLMGAWSAPAPDGHCYSTNPTPYRLYSTHSDYDDVRGRGTAFAVPGCEPRLIYLLSRHGIRYPTTNEYLAIKHRLPQLHAQILGSIAGGSLCTKDQENLRNWTLRMTAEDAENLAESGGREAYELGQRFHDRFPALFNASFVPDNFAFEHTWKQRTGDSAYKIALGLFNTTEHIDMVVKPKGHDNILRFFDSCTKVKQLQYFSLIRDFSVIFSRICPTKDMDLILSSWMW